VRLVEIGEVDRAACGGLHVGRTAEVQLARLAAVERIRGRLRTHWKIGRRALLDCRQRSLAVSRIGVELSSGAAGVVDAVIELKRRLRDAEYALEKAARREARAVADRLAAAAERSGTARIVTAAFTGEGPDFLRRLARELALVPDAAFCLTSESEGRLHWAIGAGERSGVDPAGFLAGLLVPIAGKGGGKPPLWQGVGSRPEGREELFAAFTGACRPAAAG
jgi:alanyl-tRNA synthetase